MKAYGYIRVSTADQAQNGLSLDAQRDRIESWCAANGYQLAEVFTDAGISAKRAENRPALQAALQTVCERRNGAGSNGNGNAALIVYSLSRLARSTRDAITIAERLDKAGADLVSLSERIDTTAAMAHKKANGQRVGTVPYGFDLGPDGRRWS